MARALRRPATPLPKDVSVPAVTSALVIAIDGPSGSGKSTVSRAVARRFGLRYLDTGAMYRAITWWCLERGIDVADAAAVALRSGEPVLRLGTDPGCPGIEVDGRDVSAAIRRPAVTVAVSPVSAVREVRERLVAEQRRIIGDGGIVVEGRDITTVVAPEAPVKVFLTADAQARARRRAAELHGTTAAADIASTQRALLKRDTHDSTRSVAPLTRSAEAVVIDATWLGVEEVVAAISALVRETAPDLREREAPDERQA